jgi:hypothetical protein
MRRIKIISPKGILLGNRFYNPGEVVTLEDDKRASAIVAEGHAEHVTSVPGNDPHVTVPNTAAAPRAPEKAARR